MDMNVYLNAPLNLEKICRACLSEIGEMKPLFATYLDKMLHSFASIKVAEGDGLPHLMCIQCVLECRRAYAFKQRCEESDNILRKYVTPEFQSRLLRHLEQQSAKKRKKEQLQFQDSNVVIEESCQDGFTSVFVACTDGDSHSVEVEDLKDGIYTIHTIESTDHDNEQEDFVETNKSSGTVVTLSANSKGSDKKLSYHCAKCDMYFPLKDDLKVHMMSHPKERNFVCKVCKKAFAEARYLKSHSKIHLKHKPFKCDQCEMSFSKRGILNRHKKKHTGELRNAKETPYLCSVCGRAFKWFTSFYRHMKYHTGHKLLTCEYCGKQCADTFAFRRHLRIHTGERPHVCKVCQKGFTMLGNLKRHMTVHTGEKPYLCTICNKRYTQSTHLVNHMRTHTGDKPYVCKVCSKAFTSSNNLYCHMKTHTGEKPYSCDTCGKKFSASNNLKQHLKSHMRNKQSSRKVRDKSSNHATSFEHATVELKEKDSVNMETVHVITADNQTIQVQAIP